MEKLRPKLQCVGEFNVMVAVVQTLVVSAQRAARAYGWWRSLVDLAGLSTQISPLVHASRE